MGYDDNGIFYLDKRPKVFFSPLRDNIDLYRIAINNSLSAVNIKYNTLKANNIVVN